MNILMLTTTFDQQFRATELRVPLEHRSNHHHLCYLSILHTIPHGTLIFPRQYQAYFGWWVWVGAYENKDHDINENFKCLY